MSSLELDAGQDARSKLGTLVWLLDPAFGFFVWAAHFLVVYIAAAVACQLGLGGASGFAQSAFLLALGLATVASAAVLGAHALWRYREQRNEPSLSFRMAITLGGDAIASVAVLLQFFPIAMVPLCA